MGWTDRARARRVLAISAAAPVQARMVVDSNWRRVTARSILRSRKTDRAKYLVLCSLAAKRKQHTAMAVATPAGRHSAAFPARFFHAPNTLPPKKAPHPSSRRPQGPRRETPPGA